MTRQEALHELYTIFGYGFYNERVDEALNMAIKALEQEPKMVHRETLEQVMWERDVAIEQLKELGYGLGEKIRTDAKRNGEQNNDKARSDKSAEKRLENH